MVSLRSIAPLAVMVGLVATSPAVAQPGTAGKNSEPSARAAGGGGGVLVYPSVVNVRLVRAQAALDRATAFADEHQPDKAVVSLMSGRTNLRKALIAARYVIKHAPPPVAGADSFHRSSFSRSGRLKLRKTSRRVKARKAGTGAGGGVASMYDTMFAVLSLQHAFASTAIGMIDTAQGPLLSGLSTTIFTALNGRDSAIEYIHSIDTPPPAGADRVRVKAHSAGTPAGAGWGTVMPNVTPMVDDELQLLDSTLEAKDLRPGTTRVLNAAKAQDTKSQSQLNQYWPPTPAGAD